MEKFTSSPTLEKKPENTKEAKITKEKLPNKLPGFAFGSYKIIEGAKKYIKLGITVLVFSSGIYEAADAQENGKDNLLNKNSSEWFQGNITIKDLLENTYQTKDSSYVNYDVSEIKNSNEESVTTEFSGKKLPKSENDTTYYFQNIDVETSVLMAKQDIANKYEESSRFSVSLKIDGNTKQKEADNQQVITKKIFSFGPTSEEAVMSALGEASEEYKSHVVNIVNQKTKEDKENISTERKNIISISSETNMKNVKIEIEKKHNKYIARVTYEVSK